MHLAFFGGDERVDAVFARAGGLRPVHYLHDLTDVNVAQRSTPERSAQAARSPHAGNMIQTMQEC